MAAIHGHHRRIFVFSIVLGCLTNTGAAAELDLLPSVIVSATNSEVRLRQIASVALPSDLTPFPDGSGRKLVADLVSGQLHVLSAGSTPTSSLYHTMSSSQTRTDGDTGFTAVAFHPGFADSLSAGYGKFYTLEPELGGSTAPAPTFSPQFRSLSATHHHDVLYEYSVADPSSNAIGSFTKREILRADQSGHNHNFNDLVFDSNEMLYLGVGDGRNNATERQNAPLLTNVYGKILRIDPLGLQGAASSNGQYSVPTENPFFNQAGGVQSEIFAYGLRNPYRLSIDPVTGNLLIADVGQDNIEEVNVIAGVASVGSGGQNFGWATKEGSFLFPPAAGSLPTINPGLVDPILEYDHQDGSDIIGGFVYRGSLLPELYGKYIFADHQGPRDPDEPIPRLARLFYGDLATGDIFEFNISGLGDDLPTRILSIGQDANHELYVLGVGGVFYIVPEPRGMVLAIGAFLVLFAIGKNYREHRLQPAVAVSRSQSARPNHLRQPRRNR